MKKYRVINMDGKYVVEENIGETGWFYLNEYNTLGEAENKLKLMRDLDE